jgi:hypothetical protein
MRWHTPRLSTSRALAIAWIGVGLVVILGSAVRLALVVTATPRSIWLDEYPRLADPARVVAAATTQRADFLAGLINDPALVSARVGECTVISGPSGPDTGALAGCLAVIAAGQAGSPTSGELWTFRAAALAGSGNFGPDFRDALGNSYRVASREGWIAAGRVVLGMRLYPLLPAELQNDVVHDLHRILRYPELSQTLVDQYVVDPALREAGAQALRSLPADEIVEFVGRVRHSLANKAAKTS